MKPLVVYQSRTGNTAIIAESIAAVIDADVLTAEHAQTDHFNGRTLVGFGSGVYYARVDKKIYELASLIPEKCNVFMFITSGMGSPLMLWLYRYFIKNKFDRLGINLAGLWDCRGYDQHPLLKWMGISRGHPGKTDIEASEQFAVKMKKYE